PLNALLVWSRCGLANVASPGNTPLPNPVADRRLRHAHLGRGLCPGAAGVYQLERPLPHLLRVLPAARCPDPLWLGGQRRSARGLTGKAEPASADLGAEHDEPCTDVEAGERRRNHDVAGKAIARTFEARAHTWMV